MTELPGARTARRRYATVCALLWLPSGLGLASMVLLLSERGMSLATIAGLFAAQSLTVAALELPTGGLSDVLGRRPVLAVAGVLNVGAAVLVGLGTTAWLLTAGLVFMGVGRALSSGTAEAWYVDTVQACSGPDAELRTGLARGGSATSAALAAGMLLGGALPWLLSGARPRCPAERSDARCGAAPVRSPAAGSRRQGRLRRLHRRVTAAGRATALSVQSLALQLAGALTGLVVGAMRPGPLPWLVSGAVLLTGALLWLRRVGARSAPDQTVASRSHAGTS
ncbi:hypothetical protein ACFZDI_28325 [Streptomyces sp. NPDC007907]|uniref:hypothetical protein n=1 Tax=Streptomyces sp. NPDC007907 TaxID=3364789 RepID=UPI0036E9A65E